MTRETLILFILCFVAGPLLFALLMRFGRSMTLLLTLALSVVIAVLAALLLQAQDLLLLSLALMWLAWVLAMAMTAVALQRRIEAPAVQRWIMIAGMLATTLPWFGLAAARTMIS